MCVRVHVCFYIYTHVRAYVSLCGCVCVKGNFVIHNSMVGTRTRSLR